MAVRELKIVPNQKISLHKRRGIYVHCLLLAELYRYFLILYSQ